MNEDEIPSPPCGIEEILFELRDKPETQTLGSFHKEQLNLLHARHR